MLYVPAGRASNRCHKGDVATIVEFNRLLALESENQLLDEPTLRRGVARALESTECCRYFLAESAGRVCHGLELDPKYVDVVVGRWQALTGEKATLEGGGRTFEAVGRDRIGDSLGLAA